MDAYRKRRKDVEVRKAFPLFERIVLGDILVFNKEAEWRVKAIHRFPNFYALLRSIPAYRIWPGENEDKLIKILEEVLGAPRLEVLAFELEFVG